MSGDATDPIELLVNHWRQSGVNLNPAASTTLLAALENFAGFPLPVDFKRYFLLCNGMPESEADDRHVSFWSIEQILSDIDNERSSVDTGPLRLTFADFLINSWHFYLEYTESEGVLLRSSLDDELKIDSFARFSDYYLRDPRILCL